LWEANASNALGSITDFGDADEQKQAPSVQEATE